MDRKTGHHRAGLALVSNGKSKVKLMELILKKTFKYGLWKIKVGNQEFSFLVLYQPPPSEIKAHTNQQFVHELLDLFTEIMSESSYDIIIAGYFNIQYFSEIDADGEQLEDTMKAIGLKQYLRNNTHKLGTLLTWCLLNRLVISRLMKYTLQTIYQIISAYCRPSY